MFGSLFKGLFGSGGEGTAGQAVGVARDYARRAEFQPFTVRTGVGEVGYDPSTGTFQSTLTSPFQRLLTETTGGAERLLSQAAAFDPAEATQRIAAERAEAISPLFEQQTQRLRQALQSTGRGGLMLAGESVGAGPGMVQPDVYGLARSQQQTLGDILLGAEQQAYNQAGQQFQLGQGLFRTALALPTMQQQMLGLGGQLEAQRGASMLGAGQLAISPMLAQAQLQQQSRGQSAGFFGGLLSAGLMAMNPLGAASTAAGGNAAIAAAGL